MQMIAGRISSHAPQFFFSVVANTEPTPLFLFIPTAFVLTAFFACFKTKSPFLQDFIEVRPGPGLLKDPAIPIQLYFTHQLCSFFVSFMKSVDFATLSSFVYVYFAIFFGLCIVDFFAILAFFFAKMTPS